MLEQINAKLNALKAEYDEVTANMRDLSQRYNGLNNRKIEIEGAFKELMNMKNELENPAEYTNVIQLNQERPDDTQSESEQGKDTD